MPRKLRSSVGDPRVAVVPDPISKLACKEAGIATVVARRPVEGQRSLVTIGPGNWLDEEQLALADGLGAPLVVEGAIVRLRPPAEVGDADLDALEQRLRADGAAAIQREPRAFAAAVVAPQKEEVGPAESHRQVIMAMVAEARSEDRKRLKEVIDEALTAEGL